MEAVSKPSPANSPSPLAGPTGPGRFVFVDALRGLLLLVMAINHVPSELHAVTDHPLGYMSAAEGFVFLSGLMAGLVYTRRYLQAGTAALRDGCVRRARQIYIYHLVVYFSVFFFVTLATAWMGTPPANAPAQMTAHPWRALLVGPLLLSQPSLLDILPFYCVFMLLCPALIEFYETGTRAIVITCSALVWVAANLLTPQQPLLQTATFHSGAFNLFAWQLLFVLGTVFGHAWARGNALVAKPTAATLWPAVLLASLLFAARHAWVRLPISAENLSWLTNKNNLAPLRLANTALLFWLAYGMISRHPKAWSWKPLAALGRESLPVFTVHILVAYAVLAFPSVFDRTTGTQLAGTSFVLGAMAMTAFVAGRWKQSRKSAEGTGVSAIAKSAACRQPPPWQTNDWPSSSASLSKQTNSRKSSGKLSYPKAAGVRMTPNIRGI